MHLAIEAVGAKHSGGAVVLLDMVRAALRNPWIQKVTVFCSPRVDRRFDFPVSSKLVEVEKPAEEAGLGSRMAWLLSGVGQQVRTIGADVLLCMSGIGDARVPTAVFVQQSLPMCREALDTCDFATVFRMKVIGALMKRSCRRAALVATQTPAMRLWVRDQYGVADDRIVVVKPWGEMVGMQGSPTGDLAPMIRVPEGNRILYVGNTSAYKNIACLVAAVAKLRNRFPHATLFLTCPPDHPLCGNPSVVGIGYLGGETLQTAFELTTVFATASLVESGNLTLVEAMLSGCPISASDRPYAREVCLDAAVYFDPKDADSAASVIGAVLSEPGTRYRMAQRGRAVALAGQNERPYDNFIQSLLACGQQGARVNNS